MQFQPHTATGVDQKENNVVLTEHSFISSEGVLRTAPCGSYENKLPVQGLKMLLQGPLRAQGDPQAWRARVTHTLTGLPLSDQEVSSSANLKQCLKQEEADGAASRAPAPALSRARMPSTGSQWGCTGEPHPRGALSQTLRCSAVSPLTSLLPVCPCTLAFRAVDPKGIPPRGPPACQTQLMTPGAG